MNTLQTAIKQATDHLLKSIQDRSFFDGVVDRVYTLDLEVRGDYIVVKTWGFDNASFEIPQSRNDLVALKNELMLRRMDGFELDGMEKVAYRYYLDIMTRESKIAGD